MMSKDKATASSSFKTPTANDRLWQRRQENLSKLQQRAVNVLDLLLGGIRCDKETDDPILPPKLQAWFTDIHNGSANNGLDDQVELFENTLITFRENKFISIPEYAKFLKSTNNAEKSGAILYLTNLALLLIELVQLTGRWDTLHSEERGLAMTHIDVLFPTHFMSIGSARPGPTEADILSELRTQRFVQMLLEDMKEDLDEEWDPKEKIEALFQVGSLKATVSLATFHESYLRIAGIRAKNLRDETHGDRHKAMQRLLEKYSWETFLEMIMTWIYERYEILTEFLGTLNSSNGNKRNKIPSIEPPYEAVNTTRHHDPYGETGSEDEDSSDSDSDGSDGDDEEGVDIDKAARFLGLHRSPKESEKWAARNLRPRPTSPPIFEPREDNAPEETRGENGFSGSEYYERMMSQPSRRSPLPPTQKPLQPTKKRSIFDEQPDARRIYFDSREPSPIPQSAQPPPAPHQLQRDTPPQVPPPRKRVKTQRPPDPDDDDEEDFQNSPPPPNQERLKQSRASASARRPQVSQDTPTRRIIADQILDRIHGAAPPTPAMGGHQPVRKGRGWEWTPEQETFLVEQIEQYGPAWADIARHHCQQGGRLEGRDQVKLKDKARNIKEKYIREGRALPKNFTMVTPFGNFKDAKAKMEATAAHRKGL